MSTSYSALVSAVALAAENDDPLFLESLPGFVQRAQNRLARNLDTYGFVSYTTVTTSVSSPFITVPTSAIVLKNVDRISSSGLIQLIQRTDEFLREYWPDRASVGTPKYYARYGFNQLLVSPAPTSGTSFLFGMVEIPPTLSSVGTSTNWVTDYAEEALFFAVMKEACNWMKNYDAANAWEAQYQDAVAGLRNEARRTRQDDNLESDSPAGGDNLLQKGTN